MAYSKFEESIVAVHKVTIDGWPSDVPRVSPQSLTKAEDVKDLYDAWVEGQTAWRKLTSKEIQEMKNVRDLSVARVKSAEKSQAKRKRKQVEGDEEGPMGDEKVKKKKKVVTKEPQSSAGEKGKEKRKENQKENRGKKKHLEDGELSVKPRTLPARKAKGKSGAIADGIEDENEGESDAYVEDDE